MVSQKVTIKNPTGLHLRPAGILCKDAMEFKSTITFRFKDTTANVKSVLSVLGACVKSGDEIELVCDGEDEKEALAFLVKAIESGLRDVIFPTGAGVGSIEYRTDGWKEYTDHAIETVPVKLSGMKLVVDTANGAASLSNVTALQKLGAEVIPIHNDPNGININKDCGSTHMESLQKAVLE